ncbi:DUF4259 domain-containing protein [Hymenobacter sp. B81]|uniref:DUF4259 domain-containing protein n=1 Tax=Hymenobacter sp. B81 TaxID=3344878 RepID=UPI0037DD0FCB
MATWGHYNFDNDAAADFAGTFRDHHTEAVLLEALVAAAESDEPVEADEAREALAAAEIVAAILGKPATDFPADLIPVIRKLNADDFEDLRELAAEAVEAVLEKSEVRAALAESDKLAAWQQLQRDLLTRLDDSE